MAISVLSAPVASNKGDHVLPAAVRSMLLVVLETSPFHLNEENSPRKSGGSDVGATHEPTGESASAATEIACRGNNAEGRGRGRGGHEVRGS